MRILVIGHGLIGKQRARAVLELQGVGASLAGTVDLNPRDPSLYADIPHYSSFQDVPPDTYDAAIVAIPHHLIHPICLALGRAQKPILVEKPLGLTGQQAREIVAALSNGPKPSFVGYNYRFLPTIRALFQQLRLGYLGKIRSLDLLLGHGGHPSSAKEWKLAPELAGGGVLIDPGVHLLDLLLQLQAGLTCQSVVATRGFWGTGVEEDVCAVFTNDSTLATVRVSHIRWINTLRLEVVGEDGYALIEGRGGNYGPMVVRFGKRWAWNDGTRRSQRETEEVLDFGLDNRSLQDETLAVISAWKGTPLAGDVHPAMLEEGLRVAELCDELYARLAG